MDYFIEVYQHLLNDRPGFVSAKPGVASVIKCCQREVEFPVSGTTDENNKQKSCGASEVSPSPGSRESAHVDSSAGRQKKGRHVVLSLNRCQ